MRPLGYQLYSSRYYRPLCDTLSLLSETGFSFVEGYPGLFADDKSIDELERELNTASLTMPSAHFTLSAIQNEPDRIIRIARQLGIETVVLPFLVQPLRPRTREGWLSFGHLVAEMAKPILNEGLQFAYHNHDFEFDTLIEGECPLELIFQASPDIKFEFDLAWAAKAGENPETWIKNYSDRISLVHIKDVAPFEHNINEEGWADIGYGTMDWRRLWAALDAAEIERRIVGHENPADQWRFARRSYATILGFENAN